MIWYDSISKKKWYVQCLPKTCFTSPIACVPEKGQFCVKKGHGVSKFQTQAMVTMSSWGFSFVYIVSCCARFWLLFGNGKILFLVNQCKTHLNFREEIVKMVYNVSCRKRAFVYIVSCCKRAFVNIVSCCERALPHHAEGPTYFKKWFLMHKIVKNRVFRYSKKSINCL
jgi:hypothetical protein